MSFVISTVTVAAAVSNGGTLTFGYPSIPASGLRAVPSAFDPNKVAQAAVVVPASQTGPGDFKSASAHRAYSSGNQAAMVNGIDFTLTFNAEASGITFTYQGASVLPVGSVVSLQLEMVGQDNGTVFKDDNRTARSTLAPVLLVRLGAPIALSTTAVLATTAVAATTLVALASPYVADVPRGISVVSSNVGDTTQTITLRGFDEYGIAMTEVIALNGTTGVNGKKAWKTVVSYQASAALAGTLSIGITNVLGLPILIPAAAYLFGEFLDNAKNANAGTTVAGSASVVSGTTGDVRGTYTPATTLPNGAHVYEVAIIAPDPTQLGLPQFAG